LGIFGCDILQIISADKEKYDEITHEMLNSVKSFFLMQFVASVCKGLKFEGVDFERYSVEQLGFAAAFISHIIGPFSTTFGASSLEAPHLRAIAEQWREKGVSEDVIEQWLYNLLPSCPNMGGTLFIGDYPWMAVFNEMGMVKMALWQIGNGWGNDSLCDEQVASLIYMLYRVQDPSIPFREKLANSITQFFDTDNWKALAELMSAAVPFRQFQLIANFLRTMKRRGLGQPEDDIPGTQEAINLLGDDVAHLLKPIVKDVAAVSELMTSILGGNATELSRTALMEVFNPNDMYAVLMDTMKNDLMTESRVELFWDKLFAHAEKVDHENRLVSRPEMHGQADVDARVNLTEELERLRDSLVIKEEEVPQAFLRRAITAFEELVGSLDGYQASEYQKTRLLQQGIETLRTAMYAMLLSNHVARIDDVPSEKDVIIYLHETLNVFEKRWAQKNKDEETGRATRRRGFASFRDEYDVVRSALTATRSVEPGSVEDYLSAVVEAGVSVVEESDMPARQKKMVGAELVSLLSDPFYRIFKQDGTYWHRYRVNKERNTKMIGNICVFVGAVTNGLDVTELIDGLVCGRFGLADEIIDAAAYAYAENQMGIATSLIAEAAGNKVIPNELPHEARGNLVMNSLLAFRYFLDPKHTLARLTPIVGVTMADMWTVLIPQMAAITLAVGCMTRAEVVVDKVAPLIGKTMARVLYAEGVCYGISAGAENYSGFVVGGGTIKKLLGPLVGKNPTKINYQDPHLRKFFKILYKTSIIAAFSNLLGDYGPHMAYLSQLLNSVRDFPNIGDSAWANRWVDVLGIAYILYETIPAVREFENSPEFKELNGEAPPMDPIYVEQLKQLGGHFKHLSIEALYEWMQLEFTYPERIPEGGRELMGEMKVFMEAKDEEFTEEFVEHHMRKLQGLSDGHQ
jgi:hypothetical protein